MKYEVIFFEDNRGRSPVKDFLDELQIDATHEKSAKQLLSKIFFYIEILERTGSRSGLPYTKFIGNGIWELRPIVSFSSFGMAVRLFYYILSEKIRRKHLSVKSKRQKEKCSTGSKMVKIALRENKKWHGA